MTEAVSATWLAAQLDTDEQMARAATPGTWTARNWDRMIPADRAGHTIRNQDGQYAVAPGHDDGGAIGTANAEHIARHDPAFVLADITAKRGIIAAVQDDPDLRDVVVRLLAAPYYTRSDQ